MGAILSRNRESRDYSRNLRSIPDIIQLRNVCCKCNVQFETKKNLDEHMQRVHAGTFYMCNYCNLIIKNWSLFKHHIYLYHNDVVFCSYCYKAFTDYLSLHLHWKMHEPFECEICKDTFVTLLSLKEHHDALHQNTSFQRTFFRRFRR